MPPERRLQFVQWQQRVGKEVKDFSDTVTCGCVRKMDGWWRWRMVLTWTLPQRHWPFVVVDVAITLIEWSVVWFAIGYGGVIKDCPLVRKKGGESEKLWTGFF